MLGNFLDDSFHETLSHNTIFYFFNGFRAMPLYGLSNITSNFARFSVTSLISTISSNKIGDYGGLFMLIAVILR